MEIQYPEYHYQIVNDLLNGRFILWTDRHFNSLERNVTFYEDFFLNTFQYKLILRKEFAHLQSNSTKEEFSKNLTVFLSILCYELNSQGVDIRDKIENGFFETNEIQVILENTTYKELLNQVKINAENIESYLKKLADRNIVKFEENQKNIFKFTKAIILFFEFAEEIAKQKISQLNEIK